MDIDEAPAASTSARPYKRARNSTPNGDATARPNAFTKSSSDSRLFVPFRALGLVTNHVPFAVQSRSSKPSNKMSVTAVTSLGRSWAIWDLARSVSLLFAGPELPSEISSLVISDDSVFAAAGSHVYQFVRGKQVAILSIVVDGPHASSSTSSDASLAEMIVFGSHLVALSQRGRHMYVWDLETRELSTTIEFDPSFTASHVLHPSTYLNKVIVAGADGSIQIWNVQTHTLLHTFVSSDYGVQSHSNAVTCMMQSPAIDVVALGLLDGQIILFDIRQGEVLLRFQMAADEALTQNMSSKAIAALSFRTDNVAQTLASSDGSGNVAVWDLDSGGKLLNLLRNAHDKGATSLQFLPGQPVLVTGGGDNALREWVFDTPTSPPRLLKERSGHHAPPSLIRYYGSDGKSLLSTSRGDRTLRCTSIVRDSRSFELSQGRIASKSSRLGLTATELRLPAIEHLAFSGLGSGLGGTGAGSLTEHEWDDVATTHSGDKIARTWSVKGKKLGKYTLQDDRGDSRATASCVTACGNFCLVGFERTQSVIMWNMQSGIRRRNFALPQGSTDKAARHVTAIATDALNSVVVVGTLKGDLHFFDFHSRSYLTSVTLPAGITSAQLQRDNNLLACICDDMSVRLIDIETQRTVREFYGFHGRITDTTFSHDSRWLVVASLDAVIRTFDIPTGQLVHAFRTPSVAVSISFSPTGDFLATAHVNTVGVYLWTNRAQFADVHLRDISESAVAVRTQLHVELPGMLGEDQPDDTEEDVLMEDDKSQVDVLPNVNISTGQTNGSELATMTIMPRSKWQTLINLETITARNKPKQPPKAPEQAPFFLPTVAGASMQFDVSTNGPESRTDDAAQRETSRHLGFGGLEVESELMTLLRSEKDSGNYDLFFSRLLSLSPAALDLEVRSLASPSQVSDFLQALCQRLSSRQEFEAIQAILSVLLTVQADVFSTVGEEGTSNRLEEDLVAAYREQQQQTKAVKDLLKTSSGLIAWARGVPVV